MGRKPGGKKVSKHSSLGKSIVNKQNKAKKDRAIAPSQYAGV